MATLLAPASASVHLHAARRLHFSSSSDGLIFWLSEECWGRGLVRLGELLEELLIDRQADQPEQPEPPLDPELEAQPLLRAGGNGPHFSGHRLAVCQTEWIQWLQQIRRQVLSF